VRPGGCGNDPRAQLTGGDQAAVADFRRYLELAHRRDDGGELTADEAEWLAAYEHPPATPPA
jgi:hypothetical protein